MYLLDTNVCVQYLRGKNSDVRKHLAAKSTADIAICTIVLAELYVGALRSARPVTNRTNIDIFAMPYACLPFDIVAADTYSQIRHYLERAGTVIGPYDLQIAAIALSNGHTLVTHNTAEFSRVPGLALEDWELP